MEEKVKFFFGHSKDMIEAEEKRKTIERIFTSKKGKRYNPKYLSEHKERNEIEKK
jgi:hypothetical protein